MLQKPCYAPAMCIGHLGSSATLIYLYLYMYNKGHKYGTFLQDEVVVTKDTPYSVLWQCLEANINTTGN